MSLPPAHLLIVEDDPVFAAFVQQLVLSVNTDFPCASQWVDTAEKGLVELDRNSYDLVLLDYHLPGADGLHVLGQIRDLPVEEQPAVIMLTGSGNESVAVEAMKRGAKDYLPKAELDTAPLLRALRSALAQKQLADQIATYNEQMRMDLEMARHLQQSLLPDRYPTFPETAAPGESALRFSHQFSPAAELAGDFFSVHALSDTKAGVFICDVMGHGVRSALVTAMLRGLVDHEAARVDDPARFLGALNHRLTSLLSPSEGPMYATAFYMVADVQAGTLHYATAGHPRPLHLQRHQTQAGPLHVPPNAGPALGLFEEADYVNCKCPLAPDDLILLFTDGLFEVPGAQEEGDFGKTRLLESARECMTLPPDQLCEAILSRVRQFAGGAPFEDDVCLLAVEIKRLVGGPT